MKAIIKEGTFMDLPLNEITKDPDNGSVISILTQARANFPLRQNNVV